MKESWLLFNKKIILKLKKIECSTHTQKSRIWMDGMKLEICNNTFSR